MRHQRDFRSRRSLHRACGRHQYDGADRFRHCGPDQSAVIKRRNRGGQSRRGRKGFAVVAEEIRKLADGSAKATAQIFDMVKQIEDGITSITGAVTTGVALADRQQELMEKTSESFAHIEQKPPILRRSLLNWTDGSSNRNSLVSKCCIMQKASAPSFRKRLQEAKRFLPPRLSSCLLFIKWRKASIIW